MKTKDSGQTTEVSYYHSDHLGSSSVITDENGNEVSRYDYQPYGSVARRDTIHESRDTNYLFTGKELDSTGLYYYSARYYDAEIGRFTQPDSIVQNPFDPQTLNRYTYCRNNPEKYIDPSGHFFIGLIIAAIVGAAIGAGVSAATGGDIGNGAITGAISGALFFAGGSAIGGLAKAWQLQGAAKAALGTGMHTLAGGASGALGAVATGGDVGMNAAIGGISAGVSYGLGHSVPFLKAGEGGGVGTFASNLAKRSAIGAVVGGGVSEAMGGSFGRGAGYGAQTSAIGYTTNCAGAIVIPAAMEAMGILFLGAAALMLNTPQARANFQRAVTSLRVHFAQRGPERYPGHDKGKRVRNLARSQPNPAPPGHDNRQPPDPEDNWWGKFLGKVANLLGEMQN